MVCIIVECPPVLATMFSLVANVMIYNVHHVLCHFSFDDLFLSLSYADVIGELAMVSSGMLAFTDSHFSTADACSSIEFLCSVRCFLHVKYE